MNEDNERAERKKQKLWWIAAGIAAAAAAVSIGVLASLLIFAGHSVPNSEVRACIPNRDFTKDAPSGGDSGIAGVHVTPEGCPPEAAYHIDGLVQEATETGFNLVTLDGKREEFAVRPADRPYIDIQHARTHASLGQPIRIWIEKINDEETIVYMEDPPLNSGRD